MSFDRLVGILTGESVLEARSNGGGVIVRRALRITAIVYLLTVVLLTGLNICAGSIPSWSLLAIVVRDTVHWAGAIFGGSYAALYAPFASQWQYLASTYNQYMTTRMQHPEAGDAVQRKLYADWRAGIIEDAYDLHLATKPMFAPWIADLLMDQEVVTAFRSNVVEGPRRIRRLEESLSAVLKREVRAACLPLEVGNDAARGTGG